MNYDYKVDIAQKNNAHTQCINLIKSSSMVLDLGCAVGAIGEYLNKSKNCMVIGVDYLEEFVNIAKSKECYSEVHQLDLNNEISKLEKYKGCFDFILAADVIEHLYNPQKFLEGILPLLKDSGSIVLSIPNIAHASIKLNLMQNKFDYTSMGLLDNTHIRFFTRKSIIELCNSTGLQIKECEFVYATYSTYYENVDIYKFSPLILKHIAKSDESFVYQYVLCLQKGDITNNENKLIPDHTECNNYKKIKLLKHAKRYFKNIWLKQKQ